MKHSATNQELLFNKTNIKDNYKNLKLTVFFVLFLTSSIYSQVIISPYVVYMDQKDRFGTFNCSK